MFWRILPAMAIILNEKNQKRKIVLLRRLPPTIKDYFDQNRFIGWHDSVTRLTIFCKHKKLRGADSLILNLLWLDNQIIVFVSKMSLFNLFEFEFEFLLEIHIMRTQVCNSNCISWWADNFDLYILGICYEIINLSFSGIAISRHLNILPTDGFDDKYNKVNVIEHYIFVLLYLFIYFYLLQ